MAGEWATASPRSVRVGRHINLNMENLIQMLLILVVKIIRFYKEDCA
jgi:hypothetical protein